MVAKPVIIDTNCPGCHKDHSVAVPIDDLNIAMGRVQHDDNGSEIRKAIADLHNEIIKQAKELPKPEEKPKVEIKEVLKPYDFEPNAFCTNGNCTKNHHKETYKQRVTKKCTNCGQFAPKAAAKCAWCGSKDIDSIKERFEDLDEDELDDLGVPRPEVEHTHGEE